MPLSKDVQGGGTEKDGSKSLNYCSHCFKNGTFTLPNLTVDEMCERVRQKMDKMHIPRFLSFFLVKKIPRLKRWSK